MLNSDALKQLEHEDKQQLLLIHFGLESGR